MLTTSIVSTTYGSFGLTDIRGYFDFFAFFSLLLCLYFKNPIVLILFSQISCWTDERGAAALLFVSLYWILAHENQNSVTTSSNKTANSRTAIINSYVVLFSLILFLIIRVILSKHYNIPLLHNGGDKIGLKVFYYNLNYIPYGIWSALEGLWIFPVLMLVTLFKARKRIIFACLFMLISAFIVGSHLVADVTRSISYLSIILFLAMPVISKNYSLTLLRKYTTICFFISVFFLNYSLQSFAIRMENIPILFIDLPILYNFAHEIMYKYFI
jgi:hypothetical protein